MRRLSRLARARISRVPDVGFGGGATVSLAVCAEDLEFFVILPPQNARFSRLVPVPRIFLCGLAVCFLGRFEEGGGVGLFCDGIDCRDEPITKF